jgi:hypothetical protein
MQILRRCNSCPLLHQLERVPSHAERFAFFHLFIIRMQILRRCNSCPLLHQLERVPSHAERFAFFHLFIIPSEALGFSISLNIGFGI